ncbi:MAG: branched-chain amino acid ABC transporter permease [Chloroflexi bacterium]|nr:branched-chain amino acid ABC transporter permease [Chloroflexota bacterium]MCL5951207.1 branched-chain amino acid ABC transporter permease [Chloroflexota bacterium]
MQVAVRTRTSKSILTVIAIALLLGIIFYLGAQKHFQAQEYVQLILDGLSGGAIYALIALGFVVIYDVTGIINFAQGEFVMLGAMISATVMTWALPLPASLQLLVAVVIAVILTTLVGIVIERVAIYPARHSPIVSLIIITIGATMAIRALALIVWGTRPYVVPAFSTLKLEDLTLRYSGIIFKAQSFWIWGVGAIILGVLFIFLERTLMGKALRACSINRRAAQLMGISPTRMSMLSFALAAAIGGLGGAVLAPATRPTYDMGLILGLKGFVAAIMGGLVSLPGAVVGGLLLGIVENLGAGVTSAGYKDIISFVILILILLFRPQGILGGSAGRADEG